jgi:hypothetical protein
MSKITTFTRENLRPIHAEFRELFREFGERHGIAVEMKGGSFSAGRFTFRVNALAEGRDSAVHQSAETGTSIAQERALWDLHCTEVGLKPCDYRHQFKIGDRLFNLVAVKPGSPRYPLIAEAANGKRYKFTIEQTGLSKRTLAVGAGGSKQRLPFGLYCAAVNKAAKARGFAMNPFPAAMLRGPYDRGVTPEGFLNEVAAESRREMRAEARAS